ncbi:hypothetical protein QZH41_012288 [Actinostola sp. cb2023]|nr:hypothetical protein QZH41_012288 [Actinostola sp. cb2023]
MIGLFLVPVMDIQGAVGEGRIEAETMPYVFHSFLYKKGETQRNIIDRRTHRMPKEARHPIGPDEFAKILTEKLEKVLAERQLKEREALNLSQSLDDERPCSSQSKKSILQEAIDNKERRDRIPLSTMVQLPLQDGDTSSISTSNHSSSKSTGARATAGSGVQNSSSSESTHRKYRGARHAWKSSKNDSESVNKPNEQLAPNTFKEPKITKDTSIANDEIPFLTLNNHRIQEWMATGEEELKKQKSKPHQSKSSRQPSNSRMDSYGGHHQPKQPIAQDPLMPLLHGPEPTTVLGEVRRRLMATKEHDRKSKHNQRHRSRNSVEDTSDQSSYYGKESSTDLSSCSQSLLSYDLNQHQSYSSIPSSASNIANDTKSRSDSGIGGGVRKKEKHNATTVIYWLWGEPIAYRTSLPGKRITLEQFKTQLIPRKGEFRYFFKTKTDDHDCEVVYEEVREDEMALPMFEEKIVGKVEKVD